MTSRIVVNNIQADAGVSTVTFGSNISGNFVGSISVSGVTTVAAGSTSAPSITPTGDSNTGIFFPSPDTIGFAEGGVEALRIDSSGRVGIATATMGYQLDVLRQGGETDVARVKGNLGNGFIRFANSNETSHWTLGADGGYPSGSNNNSFILYDRVNGQYRLAVDNSGNLTVNSGNIVIGTSGKGIDFSATSQAAGMSSELLADYEEGSWTPTYNGYGGSYTNQTGHYTKVGNTVHAWCFLQPSSGGSGVVVINGLPYAANISTYGSTSQMWGDSWSVGRNNVALLLINNSTQIYMRYNSGAGGSMPDVNLSDIGTGNLLFQLTYRT